MTNGDLDKKIEFIIEQQAQFTADIQALREVQAIQTDAVMTIVGLVGKLAEAQERTEAKLEARFTELAAAQTHTNEKVAEVAERLNIFIDVVERHISRNGNNNSADRA